MKAKDIINLISNSKKKTSVKLIIKGNLKSINYNSIRHFGNNDFAILIGEWDIINKFLKINSEYISDHEFFIDNRNSAIPLSDLTKFNARIEYGAIIRDLVEIGDNAIIMMGAVINIGAVIGEKTMIDMNAVIGGRAIIGNNCHIGAGSVIAGVIEPPSAKPVIIRDNVLVGANAVVLEGVEIGKNSIIAAGAVVINNIPENSVAAGLPAKVIKKVDSNTIDKTKIINSLRNI